DTAAVSPKVSIERVGLGVFGGQPTGGSAKLWIASNRAVQAAAGYLFDSYVVVSTDYLFHYGASADVTPYFGVGMAGFIPVKSGRADKSIFNFFDDRDLSAGWGVRVPFGVEWLTAERRLGVTVEVAPGMGLLPRAFGSLQGGAAIRWYLD
ncbi:MAG: hypothetical protein HY075_14160, partial [Deltaproteobacteria bacterium]|nr:hypothetical protein [Deltaproteobacteria bacterium]